MTAKLRYVCLTLLVGIAFASCASTNQTTQTTEPTRGDTTAETMKKRTKAQSTSNTAYLVATPDRGFMGNEELRQLLGEFSATHISPFFVTDSKNKTRLEDHNFFVEALYDPAKELSDAPSKETVLLFAHGVGSDKRNKHWMKQFFSVSPSGK